MSLTCVGPDGGGAGGRHLGRDALGGLLEPGPVEHLAELRGVAGRVGGLGLDGDPDDETEFQAGGGGVSRLVMDGKGSPQRGQPVGAQEPARDEEDPGAAAADDVQGLGAGEPGADRHQGGARAERAERGEHPVAGVGRPDRDPVAGGHARGDERPADGGRPVVQLAVAEPGAAGLGQRGRVAEPPRRAGQGGGNGELQPGSSRLGSPRGQNCNVF